MRLTKHHKISFSSLFTPKSNAIPVYDWTGGTSGDMLTNLSSPIMIKPTSIAGQAVRFGQEKKLEDPKAKASEAVNQPAPPKRKLITHFFKGLTDPITSVVKYVFNNPLQASIYLGASLFAISQFPILGSALAVGIFGYGGFQMATGLGGIINNIRKGDNEKANAAAARLGRGTFDVAFSAGSALKAVKSMRGSLQLAMGKNELTFLQRLGAIGRELQPGAAAEELNALPKTFGELCGQLKDRFLSIFDKEKHVLPQSGTQLEDVAELIKTNRDKLSGILAKRQNWWGVPQLQKVIDADALKGQTLSGVPNVAAQIVKDPKLAAVLARVLEAENTVAQGLGVLDDVKSLLVTAPTGDKKQPT